MMAGTTSHTDDIDPIVRFAYVTYFGSADESTFSIDPVTGTLTLLGATDQIGGKFQRTAEPGPAPVSVGSWPIGEVFVN